MVKVVPGSQVCLCLGETRICCTLVLNHCKFGASEVFVEDSSRPCKHRNSFLNGAVCCQHYHALLEQDERVKNDGLGSR